MTVVLAFGGNALLPDPFHPEEQEARARGLARAVLRLREHAGGVVLVHGNGPQVGMILLRVEAMRERIPAEPLDVLVAETQGSVGYLLSRALRNALRAAGEAVEVTTIFTQVLVDPADPAFEDPTKPIGPLYGEEQASALRDRPGWHLKEVKPGRWRRVVPSPRPLRVVELDSVAASVRPGHVVVAGGGGGVPVHEDAHGELRGLEAVVDKDRTASLLARALDAESFVVLTGVPHVARDFGTPREERIAELPVAEGRAQVASGAFPPGSMGPKVEALCDYVETSGRRALITDTESLSEALEGREGTWVVPG